MDAAPTEEVKQDEVTEIEEAEDQEDIADEPFVNEPMFVLPTTLPNKKL